MNITSSWDIQKALLAGHSGPSRERMAAPNMPTLDDITERCPRCQKMARFETYESQRNGQRYHVGLIRCTNKDCKKTTKTETLIGDATMPTIPKEIRDRYKIARNRLKMTDGEAADRLGMPGRNSLSAILSHGSAREERAKAFVELVNEMEAKTHLLDMQDLEAEIHSVPKRSALMPVSNGQIVDGQNLKIPLKKKPDQTEPEPQKPEFEFESYEQERASDEAASRLCNIDHLCVEADGRLCGIGQLCDGVMDKPDQMTVHPVKIEVAGGVAPKIGSKMGPINEAVAIIRRIPVQFRELLLDLARHEDAADQARTVLERNLNA